MKFCRSCGAELLAVTPLCPECGVDNASSKRGTSPSFKPAVVPADAEGQERAPLATVVTPSEWAAPRGAEAHDDDGAESSSTTMSGGLNVMPGYEEVPRPLAPNGAPVHMPPVLSYSVEGGGDASLEGDRLEMKAVDAAVVEEGGSSGRSSTQPGAPMPSGLNLIDDDGVEVDDAAGGLHGSVSGLVDILDKALSESVRMERLSRPEPSTSSVMLGSMRAEGAESGAGDEGQEGDEGGAVDDGAALIAQQHVAASEAAAPLGDVHEEVPSPEVPAEHSSGAAAQPVDATSSSSSGGDVEPEGAPGPVGASSGGRGVGVFASLGLVMVLGVLLVVCLGGLYISSPDLFGGGGDGGRGAGEGDGEAEGRRQDSSRRPGEKAGRKERAARRRDKGDEPRAKKPAVRASGRRDEKKEAKKARKGTEALKASKGDDAVRAVSDALAVSELVTLRSFRAERFEGFVHGADLNNRLHSDTWAVVQLAGVDVFVVPLLPGVDPVATGRLVASSLRQASQNHRVEGGRVGVYQVGEAFQIVWQGAGRHDAIPLISLEVEALKAIGRFDEGGEATPRQRAESLARWCARLLDAVILRRTPEGVEDELLRRGLKLMMKADGPGHADSLPRSVLARLNQEAYLVAR